MGSKQDAYCARGKHVWTKIMGKWWCSNCGATK